MTLSPLAKETIVREAENREIEKIRLPNPNWKPEKKPSEFEKVCTIGEIAKGVLK